MGSPRSPDDGEARRVRTIMGHDMLTLWPPAKRLHQVLELTLGVLMR